MGTVTEVFHWHYIHGGQKVGIDIYPFGPDEYVAFSLVPSLERNPGASLMQAWAQLTEDFTYGGPIPSAGSARQLYVECKTFGPEHFMSVRLLCFRQSM